MSEEESNTEDAAQTESQEPEEIDIELEEPRASGGRGVWLVIVLIIILAAVAWYVFWAMEQTQEREQQEKEARVRGYQVQQRQIGQQLSDGFQMLADNNAAGAIEALENAVQRLRSLASRAASNEDGPESALISAKAREVGAGLEEIAAKQAEVVELISDKLANAQRALGVKVTAAEATEGEPTQEEAAEAPKPEPPVLPERAREALAPMTR